jgi:hypothetical protein
MSELQRGIDVSVVCAVGRNPADLRRLHREFRQVMERSGRSTEFLFVVTGARTAQIEALRGLDTGAMPTRIYRMAGGWGESTALQYAFEQSRGRYIVTVPDHFQVDPAVVETLLERLDDGHDVALAYRDPPGGSRLARLQVATFNALVRRVTRARFHDLTCGVRAMTAKAARRLDLYGDHHRFIPVLASRLGLSIAEVPGAFRDEDRTARLRSPGIYARRALDILNIYFLTRFTRKPLRFFGLVGLTVGGIGAVICTLLAIERLFFGEALADRPLLLLGVLLIVLGVQVTSIGMVGEIVIYLAARRDSPEFRDETPDAGSRAGASTAPVEPTRD